MLENSTSDTTVSVQQLKVRNMVKGYRAQFTVMLSTGLSVSTRQHEQKTQANQSVLVSNNTRYKVRN